MIASRPPRLSIQLVTQAEKVCQSYGACKTYPDKVDFTLLKKEVKESTQQVNLLTELKKLEEAVKNTTINKAVVTVLNKAAVAEEYASLEIAKMEEPALKYAAGYLTGGTPQYKTFSEDFKAFIRLAHVEIMNVPVKTLSDKHTNEISGLKKMIDDRQIEIKKLAENLKEKEAAHTLENTVLTKELGKKIEDHKREMETLEKSLETAHKAELAALVSEGQKKEEAYKLELTKLSADKDNLSKIIEQLKLADTSMANRLKALEVAALKPVAYTTRNIEQHRHFEELVNRSVADLEFKKQYDEVNAILATVNLYVVKRNRILLDDIKKLYDTVIEFQRTKLYVLAVGDDSKDVKATEVTKALFSESEIEELQSRALICCGNSVRVVTGALTAGNRDYVSTLFNKLTLPTTPGGHVEHQANKYERQEKLMKAFFEEISRRSSIEGQKVLTKLAGQLKGFGVVNEKLIKEQALTKFNNFRVDSMPQMTLSLPSFRWRA